MTDNRLSKDRYYMFIARDVAMRGTCLRRNFGAVIVNNDAIISTGYTGPPRGVPHCLTCKRQELNIPSGERYELCRSVHAEMNACIQASRKSMIGGTLYLVGIEKETDVIVNGMQPCAMCKRVIVNAGIKTVVIYSDYLTTKLKYIEVSSWIDIL